MPDSANLLDARMAACGDLDGRSVAAIVHAGADVALLINAEGGIRDVSFGVGMQPIEQWRQWVGRSWVSTVAAESQPKVREIIQEAAVKEVSSRRQVNHLGGDGPDISVAYSAVRLGRSTDLIAIGRDLRAVSSLQQRLVEAQQALERDYWRMRHIETRYRLLFQLSSEAVVLVDTNSLKVTDANPAAGRIFGLPAKRLIGRTFPVGFGRASARGAGDGADVGVLLAMLNQHGVVRLFATSVRGAYGSSTEVELSAVVAPSDPRRCIGMTIRDGGRRLAYGPRGARDRTMAVEQLTGLVGRISLRDLVRDTTDLVERHFIEAALELTDHNRTSAAEVLGVSRQSLYVKMRRYQLGTGEPPSKAE